MRNVSFNPPFDAPEPGRIASQLADGVEDQRKDHAEDEGRGRDRHADLAYSDGYIFAVFVTLFTKILWVYKITADNIRLMMT